MPPRIRATSSPNQPQISNIEIPQAAQSNLNKVASTSLYQSCLTLRSRLHCVPRFEIWLDPATNNVITPLSATEPPSDRFGGPHDPTTQLWQLFRLGAPLCTIFNALCPAEPLGVDLNASLNNIKHCKKSIYNFLVGCTKELNWGDTNIFGVTDPYQDDTNGLVKVIKTVSALIDEVEKRGFLVESRRPSTLDEDSTKPLDNRSKCVREILQTERKYVQLMEDLQNYMREIQRRELLLPDVVHLLFANLNGLVDFQRRLSVGIEKNAALPSQQQRFGQLFIEMEEGFAVYFPFCANFKNASEIAIAQTPNLMPLSNMIEPSYELPSILIKPVQRICQYPLLLQELLKYIDKDTYPYYEELEQGLEAVKRVASHVNEVRRQSENVAKVQELEQRVEDWKGHSVASFGDLLLDEVFTVSKNDSERDYHVYLFERILLCCKDVPSQRSRNSKASSRSSRRLSPQTTALQLKGRIFINNVTAAIRPPGSNSYSLQVFWRGDQEQESFTLRCRNEEQLNKWQKEINKLIQDNMTRKQNMAFIQRERLYRPSQQDLRESSTTLDAPQIESRYRGGGSDASSFVELEEEEGHRGGDHQDIDGEYDQTTGEYINSSRSRVQSAHAPQINKLSIGPTGHKPRAVTEGSSGPNVSQWRTQPGAYKMPNSSTKASRNTMGGSTSNVSNVQSEVFSRPATMASSMSSLRGDNDNQEEIDYDGYGGSIRHGSQRQGGENGYSRSIYSSQSMSRSQSNGLSNGYSKGAPGTLSMDGRSISTPNIHAGPNGVRTNHESSEGMYDSAPNLNGRQPSIVGLQQTSPSQQRYSNSSQSSLEFQSNQNIRQSSNRSNVPVGSIKIKVSYLEDIFVIVIPEDISFQNLLEKIERKIKLCGPRNESMPLRIKYQDEDGDFVTINSDEDVQMAFDWSRNSGNNVISLFVQ